MGRVSCLQNLKGTPNGKLGLCCSSVRGVGIHSGNLATGQCYHCQHESSGLILNLLKPLYLNLKGEGRAGRSLEAMVALLPCQSLSFKKKSFSAPKF